MEREGELCQLTRLDATIAGAQLLDDAGTASTPGQATSIPTPNSDANHQALTIRVTRGGMQRIRGADLAPLGTSRLGFDPSRLQLHRDG
jgi:hypothetical protein